MSENKICPTSGYLWVTTDDPSKQPTITWMGSGDKPELVSLPPGSSVFPNGYHEQQETLWHIAQAVDEEEPIFHDSSEDLLRCHYCLVSTRNYLDPFPHDKECIVVKAHKLMEWRKAQPKISIKVRDDLSSRTADIAREIVEKIKAIDGEVPRD